MGPPRAPKPPKEKAPPKAKASAGTMLGVASKKRREDFMVLTADVSALDAQAKAACDLLRAAIFQEMGLLPPTATPTATTTPTATATATPSGNSHGRDDFLGDEYDGDTPREGFLNDATA